MKQSFQSSPYAPIAAPLSVTDRLNHAKNNLVSDGRDSVQLGMEVAAGQAALAVLRAFVVPAKVSLVDRLTGKGAFIKKVAESAYGSLAIAATAHVMVSIFLPKNENAHRITQLALNAAVVEATATIPMQKYADQLAAKLFDNTAVKAVLGGADTSDKK